VVVVTCKGFLRRALFGVLAVLASSANGASDGAEEAADGAAGARYAEHSDAELTALAADWDTLDVHQRRALLTEMRSRMASQDAGAGAVIHIRTERRYGRIIQRPDGSIIRVETQVVRVRPVPEETLLRQSGGFGVGFERRVSAGAAPAATDQTDEPPARDATGRYRTATAVQPTP
jgi:hypothetical protein